VNREKLASIYPTYSILPIAAMLGMNMVAYMGTRIFTTGRYHYNIESPLDRMLPLVPFFVVFYVLAFAQWITGYLLIGREKKEYCYRFFLGEIIAKAICLVIFLVFPTTLNRPEITGNGIFERLLAFIYSVDAADNLFPSIHCLESWMCWRGCRKLTQTRLPGWFSGANLVLTLLVFASTVLCKQHVLIDIAGGVAVVEIGLFLAPKVLKKAGIS
jgi:membrane-associated phospholipid phosphatase